MEEIYQDYVDKMEKTLAATKAELARIRTGKASPTLLDTVRVNYYGSTVPLKQVASVNIPEPRLIVIQPWDKKLLAEVEKAILKADLGLNPSNDGTLIRIPIPPLSEERRKELVKFARKVGEQKKVAIRNLRRDGNEELKQQEKEHIISEDEMHRGQEKIQKLTDDHIKKIDDLLEKKELEIMEV
ncbi:ribosome recycling factor [candidate division KSB1 bacterium]|nr:ribosome recycling factor [candidate division KSB1 bacterium]